MKAVSYTHNGAARQVLEYGDLPDPRVRAGEVLVRLHASGVNPSDVKTRQGVLWPMTTPRTIPHSDGAGVIEAVGRGVDKARIGQRVWTYNVNRTRDGRGQGGNGTAAQYSAMPAALAVPLPDGIGFNEAASLGVPAMTAYSALFSDRPIRGRTVLVTGGAGAVGQMAVQMARWAGAKRVVSTISTPAKARASMEDGADATVNYRKISDPDKLAAALLDANLGQPFDHLVDVDFGSYINLTPKILRINRGIAAYASMTVPRPAIDYYPLMQNNTVMRLIFVYALPPARRRAICLGINRMLREGALKPRIDKVYALSKTVAAHERVESARLLGNVIVQI